MSKKKEHQEIPEGPENVRPETEPLPVTAQEPAAEAAAPRGGECAPEEGAPVQGTVADRLKALEAEAADLRDKLLRKQADFENFRKRMLRERDDAARYANAALLSDLIGVVDDFDRAIRSAEDSRDFPGFLQGISMIEKQMLEMLENRWGLKRFESLGEGFDPNRHEAVLRVEGPVDAKPTVVEDYQKGYFLHERVLRPAKVKVMVPAAASVPGPGEEAGGDGPVPPSAEG